LRQAVIAIENTGCWQNRASALTISAKPPAADALRCWRRGLGQASDSKARDEFGQFVYEWPVDRDAERLLREQLAASDENAALAHQPDGF
jgi:hypothetical protein